MDSEPLVKCARQNIGSGGHQECYCSLNVAKCLQHNKVLIKCNLQVVVVVKNSQPMY